MKKIYIVMAVLATAALASCQQEKSFEDKKIGEKDLVFSLQGSASTRSAEEAVAIRKGVIIEGEKDENGNGLIMEETIETLNDIYAPATKGTPAYTENVGKLYENLGVVIKNGNSELLNTTGFYAMDDEMVGGGWRYQGEFAGWPDADTPLDFYLWMPVSNNGIQGTPTYGTTTVDENKVHTITFSYKTPTGSDSDAKAQQDLIFAARSLSKSDHNTALPNGASVLFKHALTGVKFAIANYDASKQITIKEVTLNNIKSQGTCTITPDLDIENDYRDITTTYTSAAAVNWGTPTTPASFKSGTFGTPVSYATSTTGEDGKKVLGKFENGLEYPDSFAAAGATDNLNDGNASQTFWFIPQEMTDDVTLTVKYTFGSTTEQTWTINIGEVLKKANGNQVYWQAGELRTYTIKLNDVNVIIDDTVTMAGNADNGYTGSTKTGVVITNTGNTDAYIRAALVGQWLTDAGDPVFGFTDKVFTLHDVDSWYQDQFINTTHEQGTFEGLVGYNGASSQYWVKGEDGYYYYKYPVPANNGTIPGNYIDPDTGDTETATTQIMAAQPLFTKYTIGTAPTVDIADKNTAIHFELEIATQAISAKNIDGSYLSMTAAWTKALGYDPTTTNPIDE